MTGKPFAYAASAALITGASRGIGAAIARELAHRGIAALALTARSEDDLRTLAEEIRASHPTIRVETIAADLADASQAPEKIKAETDRLGLTIDLLVNNAGFGTNEEFTESDPARQEQMVAVNVASLVSLTRLYLPGMRERAHGGVLNIASTAGFQPVPFMATYGATKAFVLSFSEALWAEAALWEGKPDIRIVCLCPGNTATNFGEGMERGRFENAPQNTPEQVAVAGLDALDRNASYAVVGLGNYVGTFGARLFPRSIIARVTAAMFRPQDRDASTAKQRRYQVYAAAAVVAGAAGVFLAINQSRKKR